MSKTTFQTAFAQVADELNQHEKLWWSPDGMRTDALIAAWHVWIKEGNSPDEITEATMGQITAEVLTLAKRAYGRLRKAHQRKRNSPLNIDNMATLDMALLDTHVEDSSGSEPIIDAVREFLSTVNLSREEQLFAKKISDEPVPDSLTPYEKRKARNGLRRKLDRFLKREGFR